METQNYNQDKLEFRQIVLKHIQTILEISSKELRDKTYVTQHSNYSSTTEQEDTRYSYIQAIENLAYILIPYFDDKVQQIFDECIEIINSYDFQIENKYKEEIDLIQNDIKKEVNLKPYCIDKRILYAKKLFVALNLLLNRNDYLKSAVYGEDKDELVSDDEDGEESGE